MAGNPGFPVIAHQGFAAPWLRVLYCENRRHRIDNFRVTSYNTPVVVSLTVAENVMRAVRELKAQPWEVVFHDSWMGLDPSEGLLRRFYGELARSQAENRLRLVLFTAPESEWAWKNYMLMVEAGVKRLAFVPYNLENPMAHDRLR